MYFKSKFGNLRNSTSSTDFRLLTDSPDLDCPEQLTKFTLLNSDEINKYYVLSLFTLLLNLTLSVLFLSP